MSGDKNSTTVLIRADGSAQIGLGHIMRCIALAQGLRKEGHATLFVCKPLDGAAPKILAQYNLSFCALENSLNEEEDAEATYRVAQEHQARAIVIDNYALGELFRARMKEEGLRVLVVDDTAESDAITADIVLNQNMGAESYLVKYRAIAPLASHYLLGADYIMLREDIFERGSEARQFRDVRLAELSAGRKPDLLVTFGGSDVAGLTPHVMEMLLNLKSLFGKAFIVRGPGMNDESFLKKMRSFAARSEQLVVLDNPNLSEYMAQADIAITAGGSTTHELAYFGVAMLIIQVADNQKLICREYEKRGMALVINQDEAKSERLREYIISLLSNSDLISRFSKSCMNAIEGRGVPRILSALSIPSTQSIKSIDTHPPKKIDPNP